MSTARTATTDPLHPQLSTFTTPHADLRPARDVAEVESGTEVDDDEEALTPALRRVVVVAGLGGAWVPRCCS